MRPLTDVDDLVLEFANKLQISRDRLSIQTGSKGSERRARARRRQARLCIEFAGLALDRYNAQEDTEPIEKTDAAVIEYAIKIQELVETTTAAELVDDRTTIGDLREQLGEARRAGK